MGVKSVKNHYKIGHIVHKENDILHIGSQLAPQIISYDLKNKAVVKAYDDGWATNKDLLRYQKEINDDLDLFYKLAEQEDLYETELISVYTWENNELLEKKTEFFGWPHTTVDGELQYENVHYATKLEALNKARSSVSNNIKMYTRQIEKLQKEIVDLEKTILRKVQTSFLIENAIKEVEEKTE